MMDNTHGVPQYEWAQGYKEPEWLTDIDREAMVRAIDKLRHRLDSGRREQIEHMLRDDHPTEVGEFAAFSCQIEALGLKFWEAPPSCFDSPDHIEAVLAKRPRKYDDYIGYKAAKLAKQLTDLGLSRFEPDPPAAIAKAKRRPA